MTTWGQGCKWYGFQYFKFCRIWRNQEEYVSLGFLIKKTLQFPKSSVYKEALEPEEPPEDFLKP
jgi:hypothetical protein